MATLEDIAAKVGCSTATISRVLNNTGQVSEKMRKAIQKAAREMNYRPRRSSTEPQRAPINGPRLVEVVVYSGTPMERLSMHGSQLSVDERTNDYSPSDILSETNRLSNSFYRTIVDGMVDELGRWGYRALLMPTRDLLAVSFIDEIRTTPAAGVLLTGQATKDVGAFIADAGRPVVVVDQEMADSAAPVVTIDNYDAIGQAFDHLYELGHRDITFMSGPENFAYQEREMAFRYHMASKGLAVREEWVYRGYNQVEESAAWLADRIKQKDRPTAFICSNDCLALGFIRAANNAGVNVPEEVSVVGCDDVEPSAAVTPPLTTVRVPTIDMGRQAVRQLMIEIQQPKGYPVLTPSKLRMTPELIERASTGPCPK